jgi:hypothetical protein
VSRLDDLENALLEMGRYRLRYLSVSINSPGGSLGAVQHVAERLRQFALEHE